MKEKLQIKMLEILTSIQTGVGKATDFAIEQLPDIAQQYVLFGMVSNVVGSLIALLFAVGLGWFCYWLLTKPNNKDEYGEMYPGHAVGAFFAGLVSVGLVWHFVLGLKETLLVLFAPKVWLLMELAKLVK